MTAARTGDDGAPGAVPWRRWMEVAFGHADWRPREFWALSLVEWMAFENGRRERLGGGGPPLARAHLDQLMTLFPDGKD